jgi:hypothetical protein
MERLAASAKRTAQTSLNSLPRPATENAKGSVRGDSYRAHKRMADANSRSHPATTKDAARPLTAEEMKSTRA